MKKTKPESSLKHTQTASPKKIMPTLAHHGKPSISAPSTSAEKSRFSSSIREAWEALASHKGLTAAGAGVDFLFFFFFSWLATWAVRTLQEPLELIYSIAGDNIGKLATDLGNAEAIQSILVEQEKFLAAYNTVLQTAGIFLLGVIALWLILQGISWWIAHRIAQAPEDGHEQQSENNQQPPRTIPTIKGFAKRFTLLTIGGAVSMLAILYLSSRAAAWININRLGETAQLTASTTVGLLFFAALYFLFCGYASHPAGRLGATWDTAIGGWRRMIPAYVLTLGITFTASLLLEKILTISILLGGINMAPYIGAAFGVLIVAPSYTYNRVVMIRSAKNSRPGEI